MLFQALHKYVKTQPDSPAIHGESTSLTYARLFSEIKSLTGVLAGNCIGLLMDNGPAFAVSDLAAWQSNITCVPLPTFFSEQQLQHALDDARVDIILTDQPDRLRGLCKVVYESQVKVAGSMLTLMKLRHQENSSLLNGVAKVTYTSGTTGQPKGVCLKHETIELVVMSLCEASAASSKDCYLSLLPLSTLLENIGAIYVSLLAGGETHLLPLHTVGLQGVANLHPEALIQSLNRVQPTSVILIPQLLQALVEIAEAGYPLPGSFRFIAVGGAPVSKKLLQRASRFGLPVYEGYGLSEAGSVVSLNTTSDLRPGSVGKPLSHLNLEIAKDGEIQIKGNLFSGYLGEVTQTDNVYATGDLGYLDEDGYLYITGRKKNIFITAFGRNVSPEWVECELTLHPEIAQAAVFGEARPFNVAVIFPASGVDYQAIEKAIHQINTILPDYAQVSKFILADEPFSVRNGELTGTARLCRKHIEQHYYQLFNNLYNQAVLA
jgi:long-subunit acyl-CoA synthetase (AMP-forming)